jgi:hypothetical protein
MGMMGHLGPMRESRGPSPYGAASGGMYGGRAGSGMLSQLSITNPIGVRPLMTRRYQPSSYATIRYVTPYPTCSSKSKPTNQQTDPHRSGYRAPSNSPRGTSLFNSSASGNRSSQHASQSPHASSYTPRSSYSSSGYRAPSHTPRGSSLFNPSTSGNRGSQHSPRSPHGSSYGPRSSVYASASPSSAGSYSSYNSAKSYLTDYKPRGGWFPGFGNR